MASEGPLRRLLTSKEMASRLGVSRAYVVALARHGRLPVAGRTSTGAYLFPEPERRSTDDDAGNGPP